MTDVNGLRLAYRGFVAGLAGGYVWAAIAMILAGIFHGDPLHALEPLALALSPLAGSRELALVLGLAVVQAGGGLIGMCFAYFFGRFFTVRGTLTAAAPAFALLAWGIVGVGIARDGGIGDVTSLAVPAIATLGYGLLLGVSVPVRGEVTREAPPPA